MARPGAQAVLYPVRELSWAGFSDLMTVYHARRRCSNQTDRLERGFTGKASCFPILDSLRRERKKR